MQITALVENSSLDKNLGTEHGLSLYIETGSRKILFDMGQTELFADNARALGIDLAGVDIAVLSHGHYDHGGGLKKFLDINRKAPVYLSRYAFEGHYHGREKYIGLDTELTGNERLVSTGDETVIEEGLTLYSCNDCQKTFPSGSQGLHMIKDGAFLPEDFRHEQYLLLEEDGRRVLFSGCSHKGVMDIVRWFRPDVLVGGFHFSKLPLDEKLEEYARYLDSFPTEYYTCHCTGTAKFEYMGRSMRRLHYLAGGESVSI